MRTLESPISGWPAVVSGFGVVLSVVAVGGEASLTEVRFGVGAWERAEAGRWR